jgi:hypothetical protein
VLIEKLAKTGRFNEKGSARKFPTCPTQPEGKISFILSARP